jgi:hypothetical protein
VPDHDTTAARLLRALTQSLLVSCAGVFGVGLVAVGALAVAGDMAARLAPVIAALALGQAAGLAAAVVSAVGMQRVRTGSRSAAPAGAPGEHAAIGHDVTRALGVVATSLLAACGLLAAGWLVVEPAAALGVVVGALVSAQVAALIAVLRRQVLRAARP